MAYNKDKLFKEAKSMAEKKKCFFIEQLISFLPCTKPTFYDHFKIDSDEFNEIKDIIDKNKIEVKTAMYNKWFKSDNATLQISLMKLIGTEEERKKLSQGYSDITTKGDSLNIAPLTFFETDKDK